MGFGPRLEPAPRGGDADAHALGEHADADRSGGVVGQVLADFIELRSRQQAHEIPPNT